MSTPNPHLEQVRMEMERARQDAEAAKRVFNQKAKFFNDQLARYERLKFVELEDRLALARAREKAQAEGNHTLAALLVSR
jgi:hypothetical protein